MKKSVAMLLCLLLLLATLSSCVSPKGADQPDAPDVEKEETEPETEEKEPEENDPDDAEPLTGTEPVLALDGVAPIKHSALGEDDRYTIAGGDTLSSYYEEPLSSFLGVCKHYQQKGWELYSYTVKNGNHFATWTREAELAHLYWIACEEELNVVTSANGAATLPPKAPTVTDGGFTTNVTQLRSAADNGMGYITRLADGSFIVHDGGQAHCAEDLWNALFEQCDGAEEILIRAWIITHGHGDHYPAFQTIANEYNLDSVRLETVMISPVETSGAYLTSDTGIIADVARFEGAKICYVHTGMTFRFCNVKVEILFTGDELWIAEPYRDEVLGEAQNQNNASIISRIYTDEYSAIFLGDASEEAGLRLALYYGDYLKSDMCQVAHHGVEDFPLIAYRFIKAAVLWFPCNSALYNLTNRDKEVRDALANSRYTKEVIIRDFNTVTRDFGIYRE